MSWRFIYFPGFNPVWDAEKFSKDLLMPELVMIRFAVFDEDVGIVDDFIGQFSLPYTSLRPGNCTWEGDNLKDLNSLIKYRDLSLEGRSIICRSRREISIYFATTEFNNYVLSFDHQICFLSLNHSQLWQFRGNNLLFLPIMVTVTHEQNSIYSKTQ